MIWVEDYFAAARPAVPVERPVEPPVAGPSPSAADWRPAAVRVVALSVLGAAALYFGVHLLPQVRSTPPLSPVRQEVAPAPASAGWGPQFLDDLGRPARIDSCVPTTYAVDLTSAPAGALAVVRAAIRSLEEATGLRFTDQAVGRPRLLIAWTPAGTSIDGDAVASAVTHTRASPTPRGPVIVSSQILINSGRTFAEGGAVLHESLRLVLLHELGHAVGLRHVAGSGQVMGAVAHPWLSDYASGDRLGLRILGTGGCLPAPGR